jgi:hypothetical protein
MAKQPTALDDAHSAVTQAILHLDLATSCMHVVVIDDVTPDRSQSREIAEHVDDAVRIARAARLKIERLQLRQSGRRQ